MFHVKHVRGKSSHLRFRQRRDPSAPLRRAENEKDGAIKGTVQRRERIRARDEHCSSAVFGDHSLGRPTNGRPYEV